MKKDLIFSFIGGIAIGVAVTYAVMRRFGDSIKRDETDIPIGSDQPILRDKPSFESPETIDTHKVEYDGIVTKPSLEEVSKKYLNTDFDKHMADQEHPEEDNPEEDEEDDFENEEGENDLILNVEAEELYHGGGYGTYIKEVPARSKGDLIYLVPQEHAGEIYLLDELIYYEGDDVLSDLTDTPVNDPLSVIGDSLRYFGQYGADPGKLFVRNVRLGVEYEVTLDSGRFADHLYGVDTMEETTPIPKRKSKTFKQEE